MGDIRLFTIGFTKKTAEQFFTKLQKAGVARVIDVRLNNTSQLAGFAKAADLEYLLKAVAGVAYLHRPDLAPTQEMLDAFKKDKGDWAAYERDFLKLTTERAIETTVGRELRDGDCLLCSEPTPEHCHRRLLAEYLAGKLGAVRICHL